MIYYMFLNTVALIYLSLTNVTVVKFDYPIISVASGKNKIDLYAMPTSDNRSLILKPLTEKLDTNITVATEGGVYVFDLKIDNERPHKLVVVKSGKADRFYQQVFSDSEKAIYEGEHTIQVVNKSSKNLKVNDITIRGNEKHTFPKGPPIIVNGERVYL